MTDQSDNQPPPIIGDESTWPPIAAPDIMAAAWVDGCIDRLLPEVALAVKSRQLRDTTMAPDIRRTLRTDFGDFDMPPKIAEAFGAAKARRDGRPDRRTNFGKQLWAYEARQRKQLGEKFALGPKAGPMTLEPEL